MSEKLLIDKNPVISFRVVEDGIRPLDDADGDLIIDTSDGHQVGTWLIVMPCGLRLDGIVLIVILPFLSVQTNSQQNDIYPINFVIYVCC